jgi:predicted acetyltransferase
MEIENLKLVEPSLDLKKEFSAMANDFIEAGEAKDGLDNYNKILLDFPGYVKQRLGWKNGIDLPRGWVPASTFWLMRNDNTLLGRSSIRRELSEFLRNIGGHIGYTIRPTHRKKGYGTAILELSLIEAEKLGLKKVLVTCDQSNKASAKIIEKNGGVLQDTYMSEKLHEPKKRYWIDLK